LISLSSFIKPDARVNDLTRRHILVGLRYSSGLSVDIPLSVASLRHRYRVGSVTPVSRASIVIVQCHGLGYGDLSCYGRPDYQTPNLDRLAAEGRLAAPWTIETAADMLWALMSFDVLEALVVDRRWSRKRLARRLSVLLRSTFVAEPEPTKRQRQLS